MSPATKATACILIGLLCLGAYFATAVLAPKIFFIASLTLIAICVCQLWLSMRDYYTLTDRKRP